MQHCRHNSRRVTRDDFTDRYLGLKFSIAGETHYGWARFTVKAAHLNIVAMLSGFAFVYFVNEPTTLRPERSRFSREAKVLP
jgi:hypothetical protein